MSSKIFNNLARGAGIASAGVIFVLAAAPAMAAPSCVVWPNAMATPDVKVAVAANFFGPMKDLVTLWTGVGEPGAGKNVNICQDSTGNLDAAIRLGSSGYALFLAADDTTPDNLVGSGYEQTSATSKLYANGIPVFMALNSTVSDVHTLMPNLAGPADHASLSGVMTSTDAISIANSQTIAVADPGSNPPTVVNAPYGYAAYLIMTDMGLTWSSFSSPPSGVHALYPNITNTFNSVTDTTNKSGFVSKSQICSGIAPIHGSPPDYTYIEFTNAKYMRVQKGILIKSGDNTQNGLGASIFNYMLNQGGTFWDDFLEDHCYAAL